MLLSGITDLFFGPGRGSILLPGDSQDVTRWMPRRGYELSPHRDACLLHCPLPVGATLSPSLLCFSGFVACHLWELRV